MAGIDRDAWLSAIRAVQNAPLQDENADALTVVELGKLLGLSRAQAAKRANDLVDAGKAIRVTRAIRRSNGGGVVTVPAYRLTHGEDPRA